MQTVWTQIRTDEKKVNFEKKPADANKSWENYPAVKSLKKGLMLWQDCTASQDPMYLIWLLTHAISTLFLWVRKSIFMTAI